VIRVIRGPAQLSLQVDSTVFFVHGSCMGKTITIDDDAYNLLKSLKQEPGDSFTKVIRRHVFKPAETAGELIEAAESQPPPNIDRKLLKRLLRERGRRSGGRK
jgi:predicted CopG family antitoxin